MQLVAEAENAEAMRARIRHRALPHAEAIWWTWKEVGERVALAVKQAMVGERYT
jgi:hypothetical protein